MKVNCLVTQPWKHTADENTLFHEEGAKGEICRAYNGIYDMITTKWQGHGG